MSEPELPDELRIALAADDAARAAYDALPPAARREHAAWVGEPVRPETRQRRAAAAVARLLGQEPDAD